MSLPKIRLERCTRAEEDLWILDEAQARHLVRSLRSYEGAPVEGLLPDGDGERLLMKLEAGETYRLRVIDSKKAIPDEVGLTLLVGLLKAEQFDAVLRASSELGVRTILPVLCERSVPRIPPSESNKKISRWQRILDEGTYVSGSIFPPKIESPVPFGDIAWDKLPEFRYAAVIASGSRPIAGISGVTGEIVFAVGPEGDWSDGERAELLGKNFVPVLLGNRIMRASTAVITGLGWFRLCSSR